MSTGRQKPENVERGRRLSAARTEVGLTKEAAAKRFGVSAELYRQHENGYSGFQRRLDEYAHGLGVSSEWLWLGKNPPSWAVGEPEDDPTAPLAYHHVREWRVFRRMEIEALADAARVPAESISRWEAGDGEISALMLQRLADALEATPGMILDVDPGSLTANQLEGWLDVVRGQVEARERAARLRAA